MESDLDRIVPGNRITSWDQLSRLVEYFSFYNSYDWLFRGTHDESHELIPKIGRVEARVIKTNAISGRFGRVPYRRADEESALKMFKNEARSYVQAIPDSDAEWLALAQHHGMPTRFLDWTEGLLIATWFAVDSPKTVYERERNQNIFRERKCNGAIWVVKNVPAISNVELQVPFDIGGARSYRPPHTNPRISAQRSVFTIHADPLKPLPAEAHKFVIERTEAFTIKKRLDACGVNQRSLFPDLVGLSHHVGWKYKHDWLAGY